MQEQFNIEQIQTNFDFKGFLLKLWSYWPLFLISLLIAFGIAYYINVRKLPVYQLTSLISVKDDQNPFFTTNTSLTFNWGGTTDKVNTAIVTLKSRSHNEKVVQKMQFYINYLKDGEYQLENAYGQTPFWIEADTLKPQIINRLIGIQAIDDEKYKLTATFEEGTYRTQEYNTKTMASLPMPSEAFEREFTFGQRVSLPFFSGVVHRSTKPLNKRLFYIRFKNFDQAVSYFRKVKVQPESQGSSVLNLSLAGENKAEIVDFLNATSQVLGEDVLRRKNLFATKTIQFIDSTLTAKSDEMSSVQDELDDFRNTSNIHDLSTEGQELSSRLSTLDLNKNAIQQQIDYYDTLESYLISRTDYTNVPAPSVAGITEGSIVSGVSKIIQLAEDRNKYQYSFKEGAPIFADIDRQIDAVKAVLLENIKSSKALKNGEISNINRQIGGFESEIRRLPKEQQQLLNIQRRFDLSSQAYNLFLSKRSEAGLVKAANVSDVLVIDSAKDIGGGRVGPNNQLNYIMALLFGIFVPFMWVFFTVFFDNKINTTQDISTISAVPILGVVGKDRSGINTVVIEKPKSAVSESFRAIRSSLQFIYKKRGLEGTKTVLVTSSVSGEGKTFSAINIASVFALSEKRTILMGLDLRKPKIFEDFNLNKNLGVVNYLVNDSSYQDVIQKTSLEHLDVIVSGPIPPNPSELLISEKMDELIQKLSENYDYIVIDSPPITLVSDSLNLMKYADATVYIVRQNYTKKAMLGMINEKYKSGEVKNLSFVLNHFQSKAKYGYGYGYGYGNYANGYHEEEKSKNFLNKMFKRK